MSRLRFSRCGLDGSDGIAVSLGTVRSATIVCPLHDYGQGPYGMSYLAIEVSSTDPKNITVSMLLEVIIRFWRDFLRQHGPYDRLPKNKTKLSDE